MVGAALVQATLSPYLKINGVHPDLVLILVIAWTILRSLEEGLTWALLGGLTLDFISGATFGIYTLSMLVVALIANLSHGRVFGSSIVIPLGFTFPLSLVFNGLALLLLYVLGRPVVWVDSFYTILLPVALLNTGVMALVFPLLYYINRKLTPQSLSF